MSDAAYHEEEALGRAYDSRLMRRLLGFLAPYRLQVALAVMFVLAAAGLQILGPYLVKVAIDDTIMHRDAAGLARVAMLYVCVLVAEFVVGYYQTSIMQQVGQRIMYDLRMQLFEKLQRMSLPFYDRNPVGRLMTRITGDVDVLNELFTSAVVTIVGDIVTLIGIMAAIVVLNPELGAVTFSVLPLIVLVTLWFRKNVRATYRDVRTALARMNANLQENLTGMSTTHIMNREEKQFEGFRGVNAEHRDANVRSIFYYAVFFPAIELIGALATALIIWYGGRQVMWEGLSLGALVAFLLYAERFFRPISDMSEKYNILQSAMASSERIFNLLDAPIEVPPPAAARRVEPVRGDIRFEGVHFAYQSGEEVLKDVSFHVAPGEKVAIVGATGSGKTTLISLLTRFYDVQKGDDPRRRARRARVGSGRAPPLDRRGAAGRVPVLGHDRGEPAPRRGHAARAPGGRGAGGARPRLHRAPARAATTRRSSSAAPRSRPARSSSSRSPARWRSTPGSWCSTRPPRASTPRPSS